LTGHVDEGDRALVPLRVSAVDKSYPHDLQVWVDTAFNGELVLEASLIKELNLPLSATIVATLADGSEKVLETFACTIEWFGTQRQVEVIANQGYYPLLGIGLLLGRTLTIDYTARTVTIA